MKKGEVIATGDDTGDPVIVGAAFSADEKQVITLREDRIVVYMRINCHLIMRYVMVVAKCLI